MALQMLLVAMIEVPIAALPERARQTIETSVNKALEVLRHPILDGESEKRERIQLIVDEIFDYTEISKRALSFHWRAFTPEQQEEFIDLFGKLLSRIYIHRILSHTDEEVVFVKETVLSENTVEVESKVLTETRSIPVHYRMILRDGQWKVYDVVIEGVSLVLNYRNQFRTILSKETPEGVLKILRERIAGS